MTDTQQTGHRPVDGRTLHYGEFYGVKPLPPDDGRPLAFVLGTCQSEALRVLLDSAPAATLRTVRVPPVYELEDDELPHLRQLLALADVLFLQPVRDDYRGMPLGTSQLQPWLKSGARLVLLPLLVYEGMHPFQVTVRHPSAGDPPVVPYHDLRTLAQAATGQPRRALKGVREAAEESVAELRAREAAHGTVVMSDLLAAPYTGIMHTINHPGNELLIELAARVRRELGLSPDVAEPDGVLLSSVISPVEPEVADSLGIAPRGPGWLINGVEVSDADVVESQLEWYAANEPVVAAGLKRHGERMRRLGLL